MDRLADEVDRVVEEHGFSGVVRVDRREQPGLSTAFGLAERGFGIPNTLDTQFGVASATKGLTALAVMSLVSEGALALDTTARSLLRDDLPEIDETVTVEHLLAHRSGIGDYVDEEGGFDATDYVMTVPLHALATTAGYLRALSGRAAKFAPGEAFAYNNSGFVVLALLVERVTGSTFHDVVAQRVCGPAGMRDTAFLRSDELPARAARGYLTGDGLRTNVLHLPVCGTGDGGVYATVDDVHRLWDAVFDGRIIGLPWVAEMVRPRSDVPAEHRRYGLGFWLRQSGDGVLLEGYDAGVSFRSLHDRAAGVTFTVVSNTTDGAWPLAGFLEDRLLG